MTIRALLTGRKRNLSNPLQLNRDGLLTLCQTTLAKRRNTIILHGPPGTGKSSLAAELAEALPACTCGEHHAYWVACHPDAMATDIIGGWTPNPDGSGTWQYTPGPMLLAWGVTGHPGILIVDDVHEAGPGTRAALYTAFNKKSARHTMPDGTTVRPHADYWCITTSNEHPDALPAPINDRTYARVFMGELSTAMLDALRPEIRELAEIDYDGETPNPVATYREWSAVSELWTDLTADGHPNALSTAVLLAMGDKRRAERMIEAMVTAGIPEACQQHMAILASKP